MQMKKASPVIAALLAGVLIGGSVTAVNADIFGSVLKGAGIVVVVHQFAGQLNSFVNTLTGNKKLSGYDEATKVVPIVSLGQGTYAGACQVSGSQEQIDQTKAVGILESEFSGHEFRVRALIPIDNDNPTKGSFSRVRGVGVSAIIDIKL